ncbi:GatB/YqeY domain-containing protein [Streptomyces johnsoniae]|uniref:GatB/YqeY n=1 Tax=Streptomyces johnsoniae TaxID=3075532 RepID=A0ABU2S4U4_9ACTN|nr:hypothetical protein [Streptomyces sp. DSM 41886]MDT0443090.1 hypothetical protein [Streptomyces sp. DSM 41886]
MRARDKAAVSALRGALGALDNAEAVPLDAVAQAPSGAGGSEAARRELSERDVEDIVRAEVAERVEAAAELPGPAHAERAARLRAEADVLLRFLDAQNTTA